jgi:hypothetical protein
VTIAGVITAVIVQATVGTISDYTVSRWGRRKPYIVVGGLLDVVFLWALANAETYVAVVVALVLLQFSSNFAQGPFQGYVPDLVPAQQVRPCQRTDGHHDHPGFDGRRRHRGNWLQPARRRRSAEVVRQTMFWPTLALGVIEIVTLVVLALKVDEGRPGRRAPAGRGRKSRYRHGERTCCGSAATFGCWSRGCCSWPCRA